MEKVLEWAIDHKVSESKRKSSYLGKFQQDDPTPAENDEEKTDDISPKDEDFLKVEFTKIIGVRRISLGRIGNPNMGKNQHFFQ